MDRRLFALERYEHSGSSAPTDSVEGLTTAVTRLVAAVHLPADEAVLALVEADDEEAVLAAALAAGWRVDRVTTAVWVSPATPTQEETTCAP